MGCVCSQSKTDIEQGNNQNRRLRNKKIYLCDSDGECQSSMCMRGIPEDRPKLSPQTVDLVKTSWTLIKKDIEKVGVVMFIGLLEEEEVRFTFEKFKYTRYEDLRVSGVLKSHVLRVMGAVDKVVSRLNTPNKMIDMLHELGRHHVELNVRQEFLDLIGPQFNRAIQPALGDNFTPEVEQAWADMFRFIAHVMKEAMVM